MSNIVQPSNPQATGDWLSSWKQTLPSQFKQQAEVTLNPVEFETVPMLNTNYGQMTLMSVRKTTVKSGE